MMNFSDSILSDQLLFIADKVLEESTPRAIELSMVKSYAEHIGARVYETSAKTGQNIEIIFNEIAEDWTKRKAVKSENLSLNPNAAKTNTTKLESEKNCCGR